MLNLEQIESFYPESARKYRINILREYLQYKILEIVYRSKYAPRLSFMGGTCIHIIHGNPRFSEDLDFDNRGISTDDFCNLTSIVEKELTLEGYTIELKTTLKTAYRAYFRFSSILREAGLTGHREQKLLIQIDAEPQNFSYQNHTAILNKFDVFCRILSVPIDILLSQKFLCILTRPRLIGRDFFDAAYLLGKTDANLEYLKVKIGVKTFSELKEQLIKICNNTDLRKLAIEVEPFLLKPSDTDRILLFPELIQDKLK
mgnify:CR=1 FL=1